MGHTMNNLFYSYPLINSRTKKSVLLALYFLLMFSLSTWAQTQKGAKLLGGDVAFDLEKNNSFSITLSPQIGYFVIKNLAVGTGASLHYSKYNYGDNMSYSFRARTTMAGASPFVRYYFGQSTPTRLFTDARIIFWRTWFTGTQHGSQPQLTVSNYSTLRAGVGVVHFITSQIGLEALLAYTSSKNSSSDRTGKIGLTVGFQIYLPSSKQ